MASATNASGSSCKRMLILDTEISFAAYLGQHKIEGRGYMQIRKSSLRTEPLALGR